MTLNGAAQRARAETTSEPGALVGEGDPSPIDVAGASPAVLAIHGYGATPLEVQLVTDVAAGLGLRAHAPLLPGHGTHAKDLVRTDFGQWSQAVEQAFDDLAGSNGSVIVVGISLGSLLAAHLALVRPERMLGLGMLSNATRLSPLTAALPLHLVERLRIRDFWVPKNGADIADPVARATQLTYNVQPVYGGIEVMNAGARIERLLPRISRPAFVAHGLHDHVCPVENAQRVANGLASREKTVLILPRSRHIVTRDFDRTLLAGELRDFIATLAGMR